MKYFFDTEFIEDGKTIDLVSIAIVAEDGREYYAICGGFDPKKASQWVTENVIDKLPVNVTWKPKDIIRSEILTFVGGDTAPEFWADYASYDWVALCQLYGTMMDLPKGWPMFCRDIQQLKELVLLPKTPMPESEDEHDALSDARCVCARYRFLTGA